MNDLEVGKAKEGLQKNISVVKKSQSVRFRHIGQDALLTVPIVEFELRGKIYSLCVAGGDSPGWSFDSGDITSHQEHNFFYFILLNFSKQILATENIIQAMNDGKINCLFS